MMDTYQEIQEQIKERKVRLMQLEHEISVIRREKKTLQNSAQDMRCALFRERYGWGRGDEVKVPAAWDAKRQVSMKMGAGTVWEFNDTTLEPDGDVDNAIVQLTRDGGGWMISVTLEDALILRDYWLGSNS